MSEKLGISLSREPVPQCWLCKRYERNQFRPSCTAFPEGIPSEIWDNRYDHREAHPDDNGVQAEFMDTETLRQFYGRTEEQINFEIRKVTAVLVCVKPHPQE